MPLITWLDIKEFMPQNEQKVVILTHGQILLTSTYYADHKRSGIRCNLKECTNHNFYIHLDKDNTAWYKHSLIKAWAPFNDVAQVLDSRLPDLFVREKVPGLQGEKSWYIFNEYECKDVQE